MYSASARERVSKLYAIQSKRAPQVLFIPIFCVCVYIFIYYKFSQSHSAICLAFAHFGIYRTCEWADILLQVVVFVVSSGSYNIIWKKIYKRWLYSHALYLLFSSYMNTAPHKVLFIICLQWKKIYTFFRANRFKYFKDLSALDNYATFFRRTNAPIHGVDLLHVKIIYYEFISDTKHFCEMKNDLAADHLRRRPCDKNSN